MGRGGRNSIECELRVLIVVNEYRFFVSEIKIPFPSPSRSCHVAILYQSRKLSDP